MAVTRPFTSEENRMPSSHGRKSTQPDTHSLVGIWLVENRLTGMGVGATVGVGVCFGVAVALGDGVGVGGGVGGGVGVGVGSAAMGVGLGRGIRPSETACQPASATSATAAPPASQSRCR